MKRALAFVCVIFLLFSLAFSVCADTSAESAEVSETVETESQEIDEEDSALMKNLQIFMLVGAVIGAMVIVALMYKKKDEAKYL